MTHNERQNIKAETIDIMTGVKCASRLLVGLWQEFFDTGLPVKLDAEQAERVNDLMRVIFDELERGIRDYDELVGEVNVHVSQIEAECAQVNCAKAKAEELFDRAYIKLMERVNNRAFERRYREIGNMSDAEAIPALEKLIADMEMAA